MDEISLDELTAQLQAAQEKKATVRLSERNVVELVNKLKELGIIDPSLLLHSSNGKEYLTTEHLREEILQTLHSHGGRISLAELSTQLNVDVSHCQRQSQVIVDGSNGDISIIQEELISNQYLHTIAQDINERLETVGMLRIGDLAIQYELKSDLLLSFLSSKIGNGITGQLMNNLLFTNSYLSRLKAQLCGALRGLTTPSMVPALLKLIHLEDTGSSEIITNLMNDLIQEGQIKVQGELKLTGQWVPEVYVQNQKASVLAFFTQNGWISLSTLKKSSGASSEDVFIKQNFQEALKLQSGLVAPSLIATIDAEIKETLEAEKWCDVSSHVPVDFTLEDITLLLEQCQAIEGQEQMVSDSTVVLFSPLLLKEAEDKVHELATQLAKEAIIGSKEKKIPAAPAPSKVEEEEEMERPKGKKKGKSKRQNKPAPAKEAAMPQSPSLQKLVEFFLDHFSFLEEVEGVLEYLAEKLLPAACSTFKETMETATRMTDAKRQQLKDIALKALEQALNKVWLFNKGIDQLAAELDDQNVLLLRKHLVKSTGMEAVDWSLRYFQLQEPGADEEIPEQLVPIPPAEQKKITEKLPEDILPLATSALSTAKQDNPTILLEGLEEAVRHCGIRFPKRDKKLEKLKIQEYKETLETQLQQESTPSTVLTILIPLFVVKIKGVSTTVPGRCMPAILEILKSSMEIEAFHLLEDFHKVVVHQLRTKSNPNTTNSVSLPNRDLANLDEVHEEQEQLVKLMSQLKDLA